MSFSQIGKYEVVEEIGHGGMGYVYKAFDPIIERTVAIKVVSEHVIDESEMKTRFYREAKSAGRLSHPNITVVHDVGEIDGKPYIVMEYLGGADLKQLIKEERPQGLERKVDIAIQICRALQYAHDNKIVHRDIKPENIKVLENGRVKIMDFGIAKPESSDLTEQGTMLGTPSYMSPEQIRGMDVDGRCDIFSFGVVFQELLTFTKPFAGKSTTTVIYKIIHEEPEPIQLEEDPEELSQDLQMILTRCLRKNPEERYASFSDLISDLEELIVKWSLEVTGEVTSPSLRRRTGSFSQTISTTEPMDLNMEIERTIAQKRKIGWLVWTVAAALVLVVASIALKRLAKEPEPVPPLSTEEPVANPSASSGLEAVLKAKSAMLDQKAEASIANASELAADVFSSAQAAEQRAGEALDSGDYEGALAAFQEAADQFAAAIEESAQAQLESDQTVADETKDSAPPDSTEELAAALRNMQKSRRRALDMRADELSPERWAQAEREKGRAMQLAEDPEKNAAASEVYGQAAALFRKSAQHALVVQSARESALSSKVRFETAYQQLTDGSLDLTASQLDAVTQRAKTAETLLGQEKYAAAEKEFRAATTQVVDVRDSLTRSLISAAETARQEAQSMRDQALKAGVAESSEAQGLEQQAAQAMDRSAYAEAAKIYGKVASIYRDLRDRANVVVAKNETPPSDEAIRSLIGRYAQALESEDAAALKALLGLSKDEVEGWSQFFDFADDIEVTTEETSVNMNGSEATAVFAMKLSYGNSSNGQRDRRDLKHRWKLNQRDGTWTVVARE